MGRKILVTGGAGFVGSYLSKELIKQGWQVTVVDDLSNGKIKNLTQDMEFIRVDIGSDEFVKKLANHSFDIVVHCAAQASNAISFKDPRRDFLSNQVGSLNVFELCRAKKVRHCILVSTMSVYGQPNQLPTKEITACYPRAYYAVHKLAAEHYLRIFSEQFGLNYTTFRLYTTYGHGQNLENRDQGLLSIYLSYLINGEELIVKGSKDRTRDIVHVSDVVAAMMKSIDNPKAFGKTYNLGTGKSLKIEKIIELLINGLGLKMDKYPISYQDKTPGDPFDTLADIEAAKNDLNWKPKISPEEGIRLTVEFFKGGQRKR